MPLFYTILRQNRVVKTKPFPDSPHFETWTEVSFAPIRDSQTKGPITISAESPDSALAQAKARFPLILLAVEPANAFH